MSHVWLLLVCLASASAAPSTPPRRAQDEDPFVRCTRCRNLGRRPCPEHDRADCELEGNAVLCSATWPCGTCGGTGWLECPHCENPAVETRLAARRARIPALAAEYAYFEADLGRPLTLAVTDHFALVWDVERAKVGKRVLSQHALLHLYVDRLERVRRDYVSALQVADDAFLHRSRVLVWSNQADHQAGALRYCNQAFRNGTRLLGLHPTYSVPAVPDLFADDELLHRNLVHNVVHLLLSHQAPIHWMGVTKGGWADAGLAHWFEDRYFERCDNYCYQEQDTNADFRGGKWKPAVRRMVARGEAPPLAELFRQNTDTLSLEQHAVAFSLIDHLLDRDGAKLNALLIGLREKRETRDALRAAFDTTPLELETQWKAWVLDTYPAR